MQKKALGKGIGALFKDPKKSAEKEPLQGERLEVSIDRIFPNPFQPRKDFDEQELMELASSLKEKGVLQPLIVRKDGESFELIAGERRWRAAHRAGLQSVPVVIRSESGGAQLEIALIENIQRKNLNPIEEAKAYQRLTDEFEMTQQEIARHVGKDRSNVANILRLLSLPVEVQKELISGKISYGHAKVLLSMKDPDLIQRTASQVVQNNLTVRETEKLLKSGKGKSHGALRGRTAEVQELEEKLIRHLGVKVKVKGVRDKGRIILEYYSAEDLDRLLDTLLA